MSSQIDFIQYKFRSYYILKLLYFFLLHCFYFAIRTQIVGFEIAEMTRFLNYISSYLFALKKCYSENFRKFSKACLQLFAAMGIKDGIPQCCHKCCPMLVLRQQKNAVVVIHICGLSFQVLYSVFDNS